MKKRLNSLFLGFGIGLFLCALIGRGIALMIHSGGNGMALWLLLPSFLLISIGGDRNLWQKSDARLLHDSIWFAPNS